MSKLKIYLNENLSWRISRALREYGYDVISSYEADMNGKDDDIQFEYAISEGRAIVTNNFNHFIELYEKYASEGKSHSGIIFTTKLTLSSMIHRLRILLDIVTAEQM